MDRDQLEGFEVGADDYIEKPFNSKLLQIKIERLLSKRSKVAEEKSKITITPKEVLLVSEDEKFMKRIGEILEENISDPDFDVDKMADMLHKSHVQFIRIVKELTGKKPVDLLKSFRMERAKMLLDQNKVNISEIAWMVGYDVPNSFSRAFKKEFGISPTEYLAKLKEEKQ